MKAEVIRRYPFESTALIAQDLGISRSKVYNIAYRYKLLKDPAYLKTASSGRYEAGMRSGEAFQFKPGHTPYNKGKQMPAETYEKVKPTMYKKGSKPANTKPVGTINVRADTSGRLY